MITSLGLSKVNVQAWGVPLYSYSDCNIANRLSMHRQMWCHVTVNIRPFQPNRAPPSNMLKYFAIIMQFYWLFCNAQYVSIGIMFTSTAGSLPCRKIRWQSSFSHWLSAKCMNVLLDIYRFCHLAYQQTSFLTYAWQTIIWQQADPLSAVLLKRSPSFVLIGQHPYHRL